MHMVSSTASIVPAIMIGGSGTRLWPLSRSNKPKQFLTLDTSGGASFFQQALQRFRAPLYLRPWLMCASDTLLHAQEQVADSGFLVGGMLIEPCMQGTAAAIAALTVAISRTDPTGLDAILLVAPSDHIILDPDRFNAKVAQALPLAAEGMRIITFGITPDRAETGFGYIRPGEALERDGHHLGYAIEPGDFLEKPSREAAEGYVRDGYCWNAGIFLFKARVMLHELERLAPATLRAAEQAFAAATVKDNDTVRKIWLEQSAFKMAPPDVPIDTAIMEKTMCGAVVPCDGIGWSDIGSLSALHEINSKDKDGNSFFGPVVALASANTLAYARSDRKVVLIGLRDMIVVDDEDALLVAPMDQAQRVKDAVNLLKSRQMPESRATREQLYPWGRVKLMSAGGALTSFQITLRAGATLGLRVPPGFVENWVGIAGDVDVVSLGSVCQLAFSQSVVPPSDQIVSLHNGSSKEATIMVVRLRTADLDSSIEALVRPPTCDVLLDLVDTEDTPDTLVLAGLSEAGAWD